jgi:hypothetical protein
LFNFLILEYTFLEHTFIKQIARRKLAEHFFMSGSGRYKKSDLDPDPAKNRSDPQHSLGVSAEEQPDPPEPRHSSPVVTS